jgi:hypothetical protein
MDTCVDSVNQFSSTVGKNSVISASLSSEHGPSWGYGWRNSLQISRVAANVQNKQSRTADEGWSYSLGIRSGANISLSLQIAVLRNISEGFGLGRILWCNLSNGKGHDIRHVEREEAV